MNPNVTLGTYSLLCALPEGKIRCSVREALVAFCTAAGVGMDIVHNVATEDDNIDIWEVNPDLVNPESVAQAIDGEMAEEKFTRDVFHNGLNEFVWNGTWTPGRQVTVTIKGDRAVLTWITGTGKPSLRIGGALQSAGLARISRAEIKVARPRLTPEHHGRLTAIAV